MSKVKFHFRKSPQIHLPMYEYWLCFVETNNFSAAAGRLGLHFKRSHDDAQALTFVAADATHGYVFLKKNAPVNHLVHECWHIVNNIFTERGIEFEDEVVAYHLDYLVKVGAHFYGRRK